MAEIRRLPALREGDWDWQVRAACRGEDTSTFYHPENERGPSRVRREMRAKAVCAQCPVVANCLKWALEAREPYGVLGRQVRRRAGGHAQPGRREPSRPTRPGRPADQAG